MKTMKKALALLMVLAMVMAILPAAFAEGPIISVKSGDDRTYVVYQILTATLSKDSNNNTVLTAVKWGTNAKSHTEGTDVSDSDLAAIAAISGTDAEKAAELSQYVTINGTGIGTVDKDHPMNVAAGYYLIADKGVEQADGSFNVPDNQAYSLYVVQIAGDVEIAPKTGTTSSEKKVDDKNDSNQSEDAKDWQKSADYDVNDNVPFQLSATVAGDFAYYTTYKMTFHDSMQNGLTFNNDVKVFVAGTEIPAKGTKPATDETEAQENDNYTVEKTDDQNFTVHFNNLKEMYTDSGTKIAVNAGTNITVEFTAKLNDNAKIGEEGNKNTSYITYSNNPNDSQGGENGKTPEDTVIVFTYKVVVNKVDQNQEPLAGATFALYKWNASSSLDDKWELVKEVATKPVKDASNVIISYTSEFLRVDDGQYKLVETVVPDNYNKAEDLVFTISATHAPDGLTLTALTAGDKFTGEVSTGAVTTDVVNKAGSTLPETGGIGTTIFYVVGTVLVLFAGVMLVSKKRMGAAE